MKLLLLKILMNKISYRGGRDYYRTVTSYGNNITEFKNKNTKKEKDIIDCDLEDDMCRLYQFYLVNGSRMEVDSNQALFAHPGFPTLHKDEKVKQAFHPIKISPKCSAFTSCLISTNEYKCNPSSTNKEFITSEFYSYRNNETGKCVVTRNTSSVYQRSTLKFLRKQYPDQEWTTPTGNNGNAPLVFHASGCAFMHIGAIKKLRNVC